VIHPASRASLAQLRGQLAPLTSALSAQELVELSQQVNEVGNLLVEQPRLRRLLADNASPAAARTALLIGLLPASVGASARELLTALISLRWSSPWDLADAVHLIADEALLLSAQRESALSTVEDELFRLERILLVEGGLAAAVDDTGAIASRRWELLKGLVANKVNIVTASVLQHAVMNSRRRSIVTAIGDLLESAARIQHETLARVTSASSLTQEQQQRLAATLTEIYGRRIAVRVAVDPSIRGGLVVRVGDELIDGSVESRLNAVRAALAA
jgi:F-type H+-transporting ATPase subunit delta